MTSETNRILHQTMVAAIPANKLCPVCQSAAKEIGGYDFCTTCLNEDGGRRRRQQEGDPS